LALLGDPRDLSADRIYLVHRQASRRMATQLFPAYLFLVTAGILGMHRFYLKKRLGLCLHPGLSGRDLDQRPCARRA